MSRTSGWVLAAVVLSLWSFETATAQIIKLPKTKNTPFDPGTWNPIKKGGNKGNVSGLTVMTPAQITNDGRVLGPTSRSDFKPEHLGQATLVYEGRQAYWTWNGRHGPLRQRARDYDNILVVDEGGVIETPQSKPIPTNNNGFNNNGSNNNGNAQQDPWFELGRAIRNAIEAETRRNQGGN